MEKINKKAKIVVIGNGPSLRGFDLHRLDNVTTMGMNAAYRYWDRIAWYPDHYCCLDPELIITHWQEIRRLVEKGLVKSAFLFDNFLEYHPEAANDPRYVFVNQLVYHWYLESGREHNMEFQNHPAFGSTCAEKMTTGAYSVRYAIYLGFSEVALIGIDLIYVEQIDAAVNTSGILLEMEETPEHNPNYFFDDYQQKGDRFQIPNPEHHNFDLHASAFTTLRDDLLRQQLDVEIKNCNKASILYSKGTFPYLDLARFLDEPHLTSLVMMTQVFELQQLLTMMQLWELPGFCPFLHLKARIQPELIVSVTGSYDEAFEAALYGKFNNSAMLQRCFSGLRLLFIHLPPGEDVYIRDFNQPPGPRGYKSGPNQQFFRTLENLRSKVGYSYFVETDCAPLRPDWLGYIYDLVNRSDDFWVLGSSYSGKSQLSWRYARHINGSAIYATGNPKFQNFADDWEVLTNQVISEEDPKLAYDCTLEHFITRDPIKNNRLHTIVNGEHSEGWRLFQRLTNRFIYSEFILNISGGLDDDFATPEGLEQLRKKYPQTVLIHNRKMVEVLTDIQGDCDPLELLEQRAIKQARILIIDHFPIAYHSATGQVKAMFFANWQQQQIQQVCISPVHHQLTLVEGSKYSEKAVDDRLSEEEILERVTQFSPELIYLRPTDEERIYSITEAILAEMPDCPLILHMMDDWPKRLEHNKPEKFSLINPRLLALIKRASCCLSISNAMSQAYYQRYGKLWIPLANAVDTADYRHKSLPERKNNGYIIRYQGALAEDMTFQSVSDVARVVSELHPEHAVTLEIYTMKWCRQRAEDLAKSLPGVSVHELCDASGYIDSLRTADALLIAYNFDAKSIRYTRYSMANKLPECMASATPILAYGPQEVATMAYLQRTGCARIVESQDMNALKVTLLDMINNNERHNKLGVQAQKFVEKFLNRTVTQSKLEMLTHQLVVNKPVYQHALIGPFSRESNTSLDETSIIAELLSAQTDDPLMIDVGAHHGGAMAGFLKRHWQVFAFEPDSNNRSILEGWINLQKYNNQVTLDPRCVSNSTESDLAFYTSKQSHGISSLEPFHESHSETQRVDTITLADYFVDIPLHKLRFLKIDTEGHDLFVLKGYPWERYLPDVIECEFENSKTIPLGYDFHDLANYLLEKGYEIFVSIWHPIERYGVQHQWHSLCRYPCELPDKKSWGNILAFRQPIVEGRLCTAFYTAMEAAGKQGGQIEIAETAPDNIPTKNKLSKNNRANQTDMEAVWPTILNASKLGTLPGMHEVEALDCGTTFCWSSQAAEFEINVDINRSEKLELQLELLSVIKPEYLRVLELKVEDVTLQCRLKFIGGVCKITAQLPIHSKNSLCLQVKLPATHSPDELGISDDSRLLGLAIHRLMFSRNC